MVETRRIRLLRRFLLAAVILTVGWIFYNSLTDSASSNALSAGITQTVQTVVDPMERISFKLLHQLVRKTAHFLEFGLLGCELAGLTQLRRRRFWHSLTAPLFFLLFCGVIDEYIQSYTGRTSQVQDVLIDFTGGAVGFALCAGVCMLMRRLLRCHKPKEH